MNPITQGLGWNQHDGHERRLWRGTGGRSDFRVSLSRTSAAPSADQTAKKLAYLVPIGKGLILDLFDGEDWVPRRIAYDPDTANQRDVTITDLAVMTTTTVPYDLFVRWRGGKAETKLVAWASATARNGASIAAPWLHESGLGIHEGVLCRADGGAGAAAAGRLDPFWRYVTTLYPSASGQCEDSAAKRFVWNMYNRVRRAMSCTDTADNWSYTTAVWRQSDANSAMKVEYVCGVSADSVRAFFSQGVYNATGAYVANGVGVDSVTVNSAQVCGAVAYLHGRCTSEYDGYPGVGYHYLAALEISQAVGTTLWYGDGGAGYGTQGFTAEVMA